MRGSAIAALVLLVTAGLFVAGTVLDDTTHRVLHHRAPAAPAQQQIACTVLGCAPIPAQCTRVACKTPGGRPTGYDVIACPPGVWPLK